MGTGRRPRGPFRPLDSQSGAVGVLALVAIVGVSAVGLMGPGTSKTSMNLLRGAAWLVNQANGTVSHVNGYSGRSETQVAAGASGRPLTVVQRSDGAYVVDEATGAVARVDASQAKLSGPAVALAGPVKVAAGGGHTWEVQTRLGIAITVDPITLAQKGARIPLGGAVAGEPVVDDEGVLWVRPAGGSSLARVTPSADLTTVPIGDTRDTVALTVADGQAVAYNGTKGEIRYLRSARTVRGAARTETGTAVLAADDVTKTVMAVGGEEVSVVQAGAPVRTFRVSPNRDVTKATVTGGQGFLLDGRQKRVRVVELRTGRESQLEFHPAGDLVAKDGLTFVNDPSGRQATVVGADGRPIPVEKYTEQSTQQAHDKPAVDVTLPPPPKITRRPGGGTRSGGGSALGSAAGPGRRSATPRLTGRAGDASVDLSWTSVAGARGYVLLSGGTRTQVDARYTSRHVGGLTNGRPACFVVVAVLADGTLGRPSRQYCGTPSADVPGPVPSVRLVGEEGDDSVELSWQAPSGGAPVVGYTIDITPARAGGPLLVGVVTRTQVAGLSAGTEYTFTVAARNGAGATGGSASVKATPYTKPGPARSVRLRSGDGQATVTWQQPASDGGRPVTGYRVSLAPGGHEREVAGGDTSVTFEGLDNGTAYTASVRAVNRRGPGPAATSEPATPAGRPSVSELRVERTADRTIGVSFTVDDHGSPATCTISLDGERRYSQACSGTVSASFDDLAWGHRYEVVVTATNDVDSDTVQGSATTADEPPPRWQGQIRPSNARPSWIFAYPVSRQLDQVRQGTIVSIICYVPFWEGISDPNDPRDWYLIEGGGGWSEGAVLASEFSSRVSGVRNC